MAGEKMVGMQSGREGERGPVDTYADVVGLLAHAEYTRQRQQVELQEWGPKFYEVFRDTARDYLNFMRTGYFFQDLCEERMSPIALAALQQLPRILDVAVELRNPQNGSLEIIPRGSTLVTLVKRTGGRFYDVDIDTLVLSLAGGFRGDVEDYAGALITELTPKEIEALIDDRNGQVKVDLDIIQLIGDLEERFRTYEMYEEYARQNGKKYFLYDLDPDGNLQRFVHNVFDLIDKHLGDRKWSFLRWPSSRERLKSPTSTNAGKGRIMRAL